jgi:hypothetical protein
MSAARSPQIPADLVVVAADCAGKHCPTVYRTPSGTYLVQGWDNVTSSAVTVPVGERVVEIPAALIEELVRNIAT